MTSAFAVQDSTIALIAPAFSVYPNPSAGQFVVQLNNYKATRATVIILNISGQIITQKEVRLIRGAQTAKFIISNKAQGMYLVKVISADGTKTEKLVKQK